MPFTLRVCGYCITSVRTIYSANLFTHYSASAAASSPKPFVRRSLASIVKMGDEELLAKIGMNNEQSVTTKEVSSPASSI